MERTRPSCSKWSERTTRSIEGPNRRRILALPEGEVGPRYGSPRDGKTLLAITKRRVPAAVAHRPEISLGQRDYRVVHLSGRVFQRRLNVFALEIRITFEDLSLRSSAGQHVQPVFHADAHTPNARAVAALVGVKRYALKLAHTANAGREPGVANPAFGERAGEPVGEVRRWSAWVEGWGGEGEGFRQRTTGEA